MLNASLLTEILAEIVSDCQSQCKRSLQFDKVKFTFVWRSKMIFCAIENDFNINMCFFRAEFVRLAQPKCASSSSFH